MNQPDQSPLPVADWEAFYRSYRKPGYVAGYEISSKLGGGMFGLVYKAQKQSIGKDYAIKFLKVDDGEVRRAVLLELEQVQHFAQVDHPNLVAIEDRGEVDGIPYLVMAYAGSRTLRDLLPGEASQQGELLNYFLQACRGVSALHERSLVHFDLKPANVFLKGGVARVGDYGLSKLVTHSGGSLSMGRGTPYYMAPEVVQRRGDQRSDIYSLGVMLYEILVGRVPFQGDSEWEVLKKHEQQAVQFPPALPKHYCAVLARALAKSPAERFQRVDELIAAMGAERSAAAAVYPDAAAPAGSMPKPPPLPAVAAAGPPEADDPYRAFGRAAREAAAHAGRIARSAMAQAQQVARKAHADASQAMRGALQEARTRSREKREQRRAQRFAEKEAARMRRQAERASRPRGSGLWALVGIFVAMAFAAMFLLPVGRPRLVATTDPQAYAGTDFAHRSFSIPDVYFPAVSTQEPAWVMGAEVDPARGRELLERHLAKFAEVAPLQAEARAAARDLPDFGPVFSGLDVGQRRAMEQVLQRLGAAVAYDAALAAQLHGMQREALFAASQQLESVSIATAEGLRQARNLQRFLVEATGYQGIELVEDPGMSPSQRVRANANLGRLWRWFLNETALNERAWSMYRQLRR